MEKHYKLNRVRELADDDDDFVLALAKAFIEEVPDDAEKLKVAVAERNFFNTYQAAHKMKPTIDLFELGVLKELVEVQDWGKFEKEDENIDSELEKVLTAVSNAEAEIKEDFNL